MKRAADARCNPHLPPWRTLFSLFDLVRLVLFGSDDLGKLIGLHELDKTGLFDEFSAFFLEDLDAFLSFFLDHLGFFLASLGETGDHVGIYFQTRGSEGHAFAFTVLVLAQGAGNGYASGCLGGLRGYFLTCVFYCFSVSLVPHDLFDQTIGNFLLFFSRKSCYGYNDLLVFIIILKFFYIVE